MEKKVRVCTEKWFSIAMLSIVVLVATVYLVVDVDSVFYWVAVVALVVSPLEYIRWVDCGQNEICTTRCFFIKRKIDTKRISSVQFVSFQKNTALTSIS